MNCCSLCLATIAAVGALAMDVLAQSGARHLKDPDGKTTCAVTEPTVKSAKAGSDLLAVDIRVPKTPDAVFLSKLPANKRDYSALPVRVFLVALPDSGGRVNVILPQTPASMTDFTPKRPGLNPTAPNDEFVRVAFARNVLKAGADVVAERTAVTDAKERITVQTRCRITAADVAVWR